LEIQKFSLYLDIGLKFFGLVHNKTNSVALSAGNQPPKPNTRTIYKDKFYSLF